MICPLWLQDEGVRQLLHTIVDRLDRAASSDPATRRPIKLDSRTWPALYNCDFESEKERLWGHLMSLQALGWVGVKSEKARPGAAAYELSPRVSVHDEKCLREAIGRHERIKTAAERWREAVYEHLHASEDVREVVGRFCIEIPGRTPAEIVGQLNLLPLLRDECLLLREVSARLFWGLSKVLDKRETLVAELLGLSDCPFPDAPIVLHAYLPLGGFDEVLLIENLSTYEQATRSKDARFNRLALVFASGFKGSAARLRLADGASIYFSDRGDCNVEARRVFREWLMGTTLLPSAFFGDLDFAGMEILRRLRQTFPEMLAWRVGYAPMLEILKGGGGHAPISAFKSGQKEVTHSGCAFADEELLPVLRKCGKFLDQELF